MFSAGRSPLVIRLGHLELAVSAFSAAMSFHGIVQLAGPSQVWRYLLIICFLIILYTVFWVAKVLRNPHCPPGPLWGRLSRYYRVWLLRDGCGPIRYLQLHEKYGPVVQTGPQHVSLADSAMIPIIYDLKGNFHKVCRTPHILEWPLHNSLKSRFYDVFKPLYQGVPMETIFTSSDPHDTRTSKNLLTASLTGCPQHFQHHIERSVQAIIECMHSTEGQSVDFTTWPWFWAFDMTFSILFGRPLGYMNSRSDFNGLIEAFTKTVRPAVLLGQVPEWCRYTLGSSIFMAMVNKLQKGPSPTDELLSVRLFHSRW